jgi:hypothetical protein
MKFANGNLGCIDPNCADTDCNEVATMLDSDSDANGRSSGLARRSPLRDLSNMKSAEDAAIS